MHTRLSRSCRIARAARSFFSSDQSAEEDSANAVAARLNDGDGDECDADCDEGSMIEIVCLTVCLSVSPSLSLSLLINEAARKSPVRTIQVISCCCG